MSSDPDPRVCLSTISGLVASAAAALMLAACAPTGPGKPAEKGADKGQPVAQPIAQPEPQPQPQPEDRPIAQPDPQPEVKPERELPPPPT